MNINELAGNKLARSTVLFAALGGIGQTQARAQAGMEIPHGQIVDAYHQSGRDDSRVFDAAIAGGVVLLAYELNENRKKKPPRDKHLGPEL